MKLSIKKTLYSLVLAGSILTLSCGKEEPKVSIEIEDSIDDEEKDTSVEIVEENESKDTESNPGNIVADLKEIFEGMETIDEVMMDKIEEMKEEVDFDSLEYNTKVIHTVITDERVNIRRENSEESEIIGIYPEGREFELISNQDPEWYQINYYGETGYISKHYSHETIKRVISIPMIDKGCMVGSDTIYEEKDLTTEKGTLAKREFVEIYKEYENSYLVGTIDTIGFIPKENVKLLPGDVFVIDISNQEARIYEDNKMTLLAPVITGKKNVMDSEQGLFKIHCIYDTPRDIVPGSHVDFGVFYNRDDGFHDAGWQRPEWFGGDNYIKHGSHGCCNMRWKDAEYGNSVMDKGEYVLVKE